MNIPKVLEGKLPIDIMVRQDYGVCPECKGLSTVKIKGKNISMYEISGYRGSPIKLYHCGVCRESWDVMPSSNHYDTLSGGFVSTPEKVTKADDNRR